MLVVETFNTSTSGTPWIAPANIFGDTDVESWGPSGGAGGGSTAFGAGGGAGGAYAKKTVTVLAGDVITFRIANGSVGGNGNAAGNGNNGGVMIPVGGFNAEKTSGAFVLQLSTPGGTRGLRATTIAAGGSVAGSSATGGDINLAGAIGNAGSAAIGGAGGNSGDNLGVGGPGGLALTPGTNGGAPGGGGGGGGSQNKGGDGTTGRVRFTYKVII